MNWYKNLRNVLKLMLGFCAIVAMMTFVGYEGITGMGEMNSLLTNMYDHELQGTGAIKEVNAALLGVGREMRQAIIDTDEAAMQRDAENLEQEFTKLNEQLAKAEKSLVSEDDKALVAKIKEILPEYRAGVNEVMKHALVNDNKVAAELLPKTKTIGDRLIKAAEAANSMMDKRAKQAYDQSDALFNSSRRMLIGIIALAALLALGAGLYIARITSSPLGDSVTVLKAVAAGDLTCRLELATKDEIGQMAQALNEAVGSMRDALVEVNTSAATLASASQQLASSSEELSSGAQEQAASQEETSATLEEITATVKANADNARQASQLASGARDLAEKGGDVVNSTVAAMGEINTSSKRIADIITAIDEIAFQTNLLALNAAVEAARAGEQGRGFAVVASEVRNLAQRSAASAKEIKALIHDSVRKVENGSELVNRSGQVLLEIVTSVKRVTDIVAEIAAASQEQAAGIEQVGKAMSQMDQVTQQTSAQTEELSSVAQNVAMHAQQLQTLVTRFKVDEANRRRYGVQTAPAAAPPARPAPPKVKTGHLTSTSLAKLSHATGAAPAAIAENSFTEF